ncbi:hypothetical protein PTSG_09251 [Salpingoeca rosetta]|uniref:Coiled-coil domain-containing protein 130 n=1 Tax=Salpingoeca rosetta (strain ATCC 50818 / BSB-021) TaxID=946362 RepID=F2UN58_SALR5|nr:uncharacterized protein PTSG_09251 [Salpingoeca rosetta]EGD78557.1 hypothetical protein PTSG_09251 [Salpingoeca rosetta]|eukprot:XP_004989506.1 hypothetical protein PTSG_09251 [Salpingoeca rosetta]
MADRKASNKWIPPDFDPKKTSSINAYHGSHPLRERARKIKQGILVIRFEAPWNFWCESCGAHIGRGVRWNAEKKKVGAYYSTPIYAFTFTCHLCSNTIVFETDPKNCDYRITKGGRRKKDTWDADDAQSIVVPDQQEKDKRAQDPMYMLEHQASDKHRAAEQQPRLVRLVQLKEQTTKHDYDINSKLRNSFRQEKRKLKAKADKDNALLSKASLDIKLVPEDEGDVALAKHTTFGQHTPTTMRTARDAIKRQSIFSHAYTSSASKHSQSDNNSSNRSRSGGDTPRAQVT